MKIFSQNKFFGVGLKNYRVEVGIKIMSIHLYIHTKRARDSFELGIVGYLSFIIFFILSYLNYKTNSNNLINILNWLIINIITSFIPLLPSGSFFYTLLQFLDELCFMNLSQKKLKL